MNSQRNKFLALSLASLVILSAVLLTLSREEDRLEIDPSLFAIAETEKIDEVRFVRAGDTVDLSFDGTRWKVNHQWDADVQLIKVLMATLRQAQPHRPVASVLLDTVNDRLARKGTHVIVSAAGATQLDFIAGGNDSKSEAWFKKTGEEQPYSMIIPGYRVYVSGIFELGASGWRNKRIFDFNWRNFKSLTATYSREPKEGFSIEMKQRYFGIKGMEEADTTRLNDYLDAVSLLLAKRFVDRDHPKGDSLLRTGPVARLEIRDIADRIYGIELFAPGKEDSEVLGRLLDGQWVVFDRSEVPAIVRRRSFFLPEQPR
ncbi:MAG: hypothetical protein JNL40_05850 [Cyclobacteriaceae bacterium]|nr:hypothetical protein [Cyclobacteriaceae bacterium]